MDFTKRQRYLIMLSQCSHIEKPTKSQLGAICPHLTPNQVAWLYHTDGIHRFALPPVKVRGLFQLAEYSNLPAQHYLKVSAQGQPATEEAPVRYQSQAMAYAEAYWASELTQCLWIDALTIFVANRPQPQPHAPLRPSRVHLGLTCKWETILRETNLRAKVTKWNNAIKAMTLDPFEGSEIIATARREYAGYNCGYCGGGILRQSCSGCSQPYNIASPGWDVPLPPHLVDFLRDNNYLFPKAPVHLYM